MSLQRWGALAALPCGAIPMKAFQKVRKWIACFAPGGASALAMGVSHGTEYCVWLCAVAFVPLLISLRLDRFGVMCLQLVVTFGLFQTISFLWVRDIGTGSTVILAYAVSYHVGWLLLPLLILGSCRNRCGVMLLILPAAWSLMELSADWLLLRVWSPILGQPLVEWPIVSQACAVFGPHFTSYVVLSTNVAVATWLRNASRRTRFVGIVHALSVICLSTVFGRLWLAAPAENVVALRAGIVQPNISNEMKWDENRRERLLGRFDRLIDAILPASPEIIILPETAVAGFIRFDQQLTDWVRATVIRTKCPLLFGSLDRSDDARCFYNAAVLVTTDGRVIIYHKRRLLPFGEYLPNWTPWKSPPRALQQQRSGERPETFEPGRQPMVFWLNEGVTIAPLICMEDSFPGALRESASQGATLAIALIDTAWTRHELAYRQHLQRARLTAISAGTSMVRCANSGLSCVIDNHGRVLDQLHESHKRERQVAGSYVSDRQFPSRTTIFRRYGDSIPFLFCIAAIGLGIVVSTQDCHLRYFIDDSC